MPLAGMPLAGMPLACWIHWAVQGEEDATLTKTCYAPFGASEASFCEALAEFLLFCQKRWVSLASCLCGTATVNLYTLKRRRRVCCVGSGPVWLRVLGPNRGALSEVVVRGMIRHGPEGWRLDTGTGGAAGFRLTCRSRSSMSVMEPLPLSASSLDRRAAAARGSCIASVGR